MEALIHQVTSRKGRVGGEADQIVACSLDLYDAATILAEQRIVELDLMTNTAMRAPGEAQGSFAVESAVDELAIELGLDPVDLRLLNQPGDKSPVHGTRYSHRRLAQTLEQGRDLFGWADRPRPGTRDGKDLVGWGVAAAIHPAWEFVANVQLTVDATGERDARLRLPRDGHGHGDRRRPDGRRLPRGAARAGHRALRRLRPADRPRCGRFRPDREPGRLDREGLPRHAQAAGRLGVQGGYAGRLRPRRGPDPRGRAVAHGGGGCRHRAARPCGGRCGSCPRW